MGKIDSFTITYGNRQNPVYRPGDTIFGRVTFVVSGEISINNVRIYCYGAALTKWNTSSQKAHESDSRSKESYFQKYNTLIDGTDNPKLTEGRYSFTYRFELPNDNLPTSFEGQLGAIRYWLKFRVDKTFPGIDFTRLLPFTVLAHINVNDFKTKVSRNNSKTISKALGFGNAGTLELSASLERSAFCPGEKILINLLAKNDSTKDLGNISIRLVQRAWFSVGKENDAQMLVVKAVVAPEKLKKNDKIEWTKHPFEVPAIPSSTADRSCHIIEVSYFLEIEIEVPMGFDMAIKLPVKIGTVPFGAKRVVTKGQHDDCKNYNRVGLTKTVSIKKCEKGIKLCSKTDSELPFPDMTHTPFTACVVASSTTSTNKTTTTSAAAANSKPNTPAAVPAPSTPAKVTHNHNVPQAIPSAPPSEMKVFPPADMTSVPPQGMGAFPPQGAYGGAMSMPPHMMMPMPFPNEAPPAYDSICNTPIAPINTPAPTPTPTPQPNKPAAKAQPTPAAKNSTTQKSTPKKAATPVSTVTWKGATIGAVFPTKCLPEMKDLLKNDKKLLDAQDGRLLAIFDEFEIAPPAQTAAIFVIFRSEPQALEWAQRLISSNPAPDLEVFLAVNASLGSSDLKDISLYPYVSFNISYKDPTKTIPDELNKTYVNMSKQIVPPLRMQFGGKSLLIATKVQLLSGSWADRPYLPEYVTESVTMWPTKALHDAFTKELNSLPEFKVFLELFRMRSTSLIVAKTTIPVLE